MAGGCLLIGCALDCVYGDDGGAGEAVSDDDDNDEE